jgi:Polyglycine hydrolase-like, structural repeat
MRPSDFGIHYATCGNDDLRLKGEITAQRFWAAGRSERCVESRLWGSIMVFKRHICEFSLFVVLLTAPAVYALDYQFPFKGDDLEPGQRVHTGNHLPGIQGEGEDLGMLRYLGDGKWSEFKQGSIQVNSNYVIHKKAVYAMADGSIVGCWRNAPENPKPYQLHEKFVTGTKLVNGKSVEVGLIPGGGNMLFVDNVDGKRVLYAHMIPGTIPAGLCPNNDQFFPTAMTIPEGDAFLMLSPPFVTIKKGQFLGNAGNSGSSDFPHLHIHAEQAGNAAIMTFANGLYKKFVTNNTNIKGGWASFAGKEVPDGEVLIRPPRETSYRMVDFEAYEVNGKLTYVGIFKRGSYGPMALFDSDWNNFLTGWQAIEAQGYRMKDFECYQQGGKQRYAGIFAPGSHAPMALFKDSWQAFLDGWKSIETQGYRMKDFEVCKTGGKNLYAGIFEPGGYAPMALFKASWNEFLAGWKTIEGKGYRMKDLEIFRDGSHKTYAGIFEPGTHAPMALFKSTWSEFLAGWKAIEANGYRMIDFEVDKHGSGLTYAGIFEPGLYNPAALFISGDWDAFTEAWQQLE